MRERDITYELESTQYRLAFYEWGDERRPPIVCVHGLTRTGRDFDALARSLAADFHVICPDLPGRGHSQWLDHASHYTLATYVGVLRSLLTRVGRPVGWVGTSLGGLCGMALAASGNEIARLVLNDIGPFIPAVALRRISAYLTSAPKSFLTLNQLEQTLRAVHAPFGRLTDEEWAEMARHSSRILPNGEVALHYDPAIAAQVGASEPTDVDLWSMWAAITMPRLVLRGQTSDVLLPETFDRMITEGAAGYVVADAGHAPALLDAPTIAVVRDFLRQP